jgi:lipoate-protein ligase A
MTSNFCLLIHPPAAGPWNMAVDETLLESAAADGQCTLRFYQWQEPTLSLGYFQTYADRWQHAASRQAIAVRRLSGGGAILHDGELTYSFAIPSRHVLASDRLRFYRATHNTLIAALAEWNIEATLFSRHDSLPNGELGYPAESRPPRTGQREPFLCFQRRSPGDVLIGGVKVAGSAQRRCRGAVLQHGSVLLWRSTLAPELSGLKEAADKIVEPQRLTEAWLARLSDSLAANEKLGVLSEEQQRRAATLVCEKYAVASWNQWRGRLSTA